jgi:hypothetical protein
MCDCINVSTNELVKGLIRTLQTNSLVVIALTKEKHPGECSTISIFWGSTLALF